MRKSIIGITIVTMLITLGGLNAAVAHAATWHNGTPKNVHGTWQRTAHAGLGSNRFSYKEGIHFSPTALDSFGLGDGLVMNHLKYRKVGHSTYILRGREYRYSKKIYQIKVIKSGKKLKWQIVSPKAYRQSSKTTWYLKH